MPSSIMNYETEVLSLRADIDKAIQLCPKESETLSTYDLITTLESMKNKILVLNAGVLEEWSAIEDMEHAMRMDEMYETSDAPPVVQP